MEAIADHLAFFVASGRILLHLLAVVAVCSALWGSANLCRREPLLPRLAAPLLRVALALFLCGFVLICRFHYQIHQLLPIELPPQLTGWLNDMLTRANRTSAYGLPLYDPAAPPRYALPLWIENGKYYFWFLCYTAMALIAHQRLNNHRFRAALHLLLAVQVAILFVAADPFNQPLPRFFAEVTPWFQPAQNPMQRLGLFMQLYPRMVFYYNAHYMWFHPPLLFLSYAAITITFATSCLMLARRDLFIESLGYDFAKLGFLLLTLGMLLGYPWALQAWGPNWWWDPKICSSIMLWAVFSTYLHARLYANKPHMWYFSSFLGILCFAAMIFTLLASFFFPGEHTMQ
ncbi:MAG: cytochrome c biogenesis protein [Desulfobulbaceae bacterium]|nr:cytochrome c biogenesis protein [Desulfobulbaceae bacterium]